MGLVSTSKGSFTFSVHFTLVSNPLFSEGAPSIPLFPGFAAKNLHFSLLFQFPSRPWPLPLVSCAKSLFWQAEAYFVYFLA